MIPQLFLQTSKTLIMSENWLRVTVLSIRLRWHQKKSSLSILQIQMMHIQIISNPVTILIFSKSNYPQLTLLNMLVSPDLSQETFLICYNGSPVTRKWSPLFFPLAWHSTTEVTQQQPWGLKNCMASQSSFLECLHCTKLICLILQWKSILEYKFSWRLCVFFFDKSSFPKMPIN